MRTDSFVSVVAPLRDDADLVEGFVEDVLAVLAANYENYELVLVDDGSRDDTADKVTALLARRDCVRLLRLSRSFGQEIAISAGLESVIGDYVVVMLPDSDPPALIPRMVERSRQGVGIVFGIRRSRKSDPLLLRLGASGFYWLSNKVFQLNLPKDSTHFRVMRRQVVNALIQVKDRMRYLRTLSAYVGYANQEMVYDPVPRRATPRTKTLVEGLSLALRIMVANSLQPLRIVGWLCVIAAGANAASAVYLLSAIALGRNGIGGSAVSLQLSIMFVVLFLVLAVLCAYLGRSLNEGRDRPLYFIMEERNSAILVPDALRKNVVTEPVAR